MLQLISLPMDKLYRENRMPMIFFGSIYSIFTLVILLVYSGNLSANELTLFDAHIHYSADVWEAIPPQNAIDKLKNNGIQRAIVSSTPANGAIKLHTANPELVIPFLRPYRSTSDRNDWYKNPEILKYVQSHL